MKKWFIVYINSRETQDGFAIEFARRGYDNGTRRGVSRRDGSWRLEQ